MIPFKRHYYILKLPQKTIIIKFRVALRIIYDFLFIYQYV
jgi:hypothetical protein